MHIRLEFCLQRLERTAKRRYPTRESPELEADMRCLGFLELRRGTDVFAAWNKGDEASAAEGVSLLKLARARRLGGWKPTDKDALDKQDRAKLDAVWRLRDALGRRHKLYPSVYRFDVLDLTEAEITRLADVTEKATGASDLVSVADVVGRLRLDGRVMDITAFVALVLHGEIRSRRGRVNQTGDALQFILF